MTSFDSEYFDGREDARHHVLAHERDAVEITYETNEPSFHTDGIQPRDVIPHVEPPHRYLYPRPIETAGEAKALYLADDISILELERYLESVMEETEETKDTEETKGAGP